MASRFKIVGEEIYRRIKRQKRKRKHKEKHGVLGERFQKVSEIKKLQSKFRRVPERCPPPNTRSQFYSELQCTKRKRVDYKPDCLKVMQASLERYLNSKVYPNSIIQDREFLNSRKVLKGKARNLQKQAKECRSDQTDQEV